MNGYTVAITTDSNQIPKYFKVIDDLEQMKETVYHDLSENNLVLLLN